MAIWDKFLTESDKRVFSASGYGAFLGPGARPALLVVDVSYAFTGSKGESLLESIEKWPNSCGPTAWEAIPHINALLSSARDKGIPVFYSTGYDARPDGIGRGLWRNSRADDHAAPEALSQEIVQEISPTERDVVFRKRSPSFFHGTPLVSDLVALNVDTVIVCGTTTSGCVRATVVDAFSHNLRAVVSEEGCFDRGEVSHAISLFDMDAKYADVIQTAAIVEYMNGLQDDLYAGQMT
jgi:maleamate amidohydrolase